MPGFHCIGTYLLAPWYEGGHWRLNAASKQEIPVHQHEVPQRERGQEGTTSALSFSVSPKGVHDVWIIMWMSDQCHAVPQHLTHCPIDRQHNLCNITRMQIFSEKSYGSRAPIPRDSEVSPASSVQKCAD